MAESIACCFSGSRSLPSIATSFYHTPKGMAALTWTRTLMGHSLRADFHLQHHILTHYLHLKRWLFWNRQSSKTLRFQHNRVQFYWDLSRVKFLTGPEPVSGFFFAIVVNGELALLVGDSDAVAGGGIRSRWIPESPNLILRREIVFAHQAYTTHARFGHETREISIDCNTHRDPRLTLSVDGRTVMKVKRLRWKFRGSEKLVVDGAQIRVSWDVYNWLFGDDSSSHQAVFMFQFPQNGDLVEDWAENFDTGSLPLWQPVEMEKIMSRNVKQMLKTGSSSSLSSASSVSSWPSIVDSKLQRSSGFSLLIYAWRH